MKLINKLRDVFMSTFAVILIVAVVGLLVWFDYYVWELKHPTAPFWTYFFK